MHYFPLAFRFFGSFLGVLGLEGLSACVVTGFT